jgi:hypothetical protein
VDNYNSYADGSTNDGGEDPKPCNPKKPGCTGFDLPVGVPSGAALVHRGHHDEVWVKSRTDGGLWFFHIRLAPGSPGKQ